MSMKSSVWARNLVGITPVAKLIALDLADVSGHEEAASRSIADLAEFSCCTEDEILVAVEVLRDHVALISVDAERVRCVFPIDSEPEFVARTRSAEARAVHARRPHWLYVISKGGNVKIGISGQVEKRLESLRTYFPGEIEVHLSVKGQFRAIRRAEQAAHLRLKDHALGAEWFMCSVDDALSVVRATLREHGIIVD